MFVSAPWEHTALIQQLQANLEEDDVLGLWHLDMRLKLRQINLLSEMLQVFQALEHFETVTRAPGDKGGDSHENKV